MRIFRVMSPKAVDYMKDHLVTIEDHLPVEFYVENLKTAIVSDKMFVLQAWDGEDLRGFLVASIYGDQPFVFVLQVWMDPTLPDSSVLDKMFVRLQLWAHVNEKREIRMETRRDPDAFQRKWGFKPRSTIMSFDVRIDFDALAHKDIVAQDESLDSKLSEEV